MKFLSKIFGKQDKTPEKKTAPIKKEGIENKIENKKVNQNPETLNREKPSGLLGKAPQIGPIPAGFPFYLEDITTPEDILNSINRHLQAHAKDDKLIIQNITYLIFYGFKTHIITPQNLEYTLKQYNKIMHEKIKNKDPHSSNKKLDTIITIVLRISDFLSFLSTDTTTTNLSIEGDERVFQYIQFLTTNTNNRNNTLSRTNALLDPNSIHKEKEKLLEYSNKTIQSLSEVVSKVVINNITYHLKYIKSDKSSQNLLSIIIDSNTSVFPKEKEVYPLKSYIFPKELLHAGDFVIHLNQYGDFVGLAGQLLHPQDENIMNLLLFGIYKTINKDIEKLKKKEPRKTPISEEIAHDKALFLNNQKKLKAEEEKAREAKEAKEAKERIANMTPEEKKAKKARLQKIAEEERKRRIAKKREEREREKEKEREKREAAKIQQAKKIAAQKEREKQNKINTNNKKQEQAAKAEAKKEKYIDQRRTQFGDTKEQASERYKYITKAIKKGAEPNDAEIKYDFLLLLKESTSIHSIKKAEQRYKAISKIFAKTPNKDTKANFEYINTLFENEEKTGIIQKKYTKLQSLLNGGVPQYNAQIIVDLNFAQSTEESSNAIEYNYTLTTTSPYKNSVKKIHKKIKSDPTLEKNLNNAIRKLMNDPHDPSLDSHKVHLKKDGKEYFASDITGDYRILWQYSSQNEKEIELIDIGIHDTLYLK